MICEKARNRQMFLTIRRNMQLLSRQGLVFQRNNNEGNFEQLMKLSAKVDHRITSWIEKKQEMYLHHDMQNSIIKLLTFMILRDTKKISMIAYCTRQWPMK